MKKQAKMEELQRIHDDYEASMRQYNGRAAAGAAGRGGGPAVKVKPTGGGGGKQKSLAKGGAKGAAKRSTRPMPLQQVRGGGGQ